MPAEADLLPTDPLAERRAQQGVTPEAIRRATQIWGEEARALLERLLAEFDLDEREIAGVLFAGWKYGDSVAHHSAEEIARLERELAEEAEARRREFIADVLPGRLAGAALVARASALGLDPLQSLRRRELQPRELRGARTHD